MMAVRGLLRHREDDLDVLQARRAAVAHQPRARDRRAGAAVARLGEGEEDVPDRRRSPARPQRRADRPGRAPRPSARRRSVRTGPPSVRMPHAAGPLGDDRTRRPGRKSRPQGCSSPSATISALTACRLGVEASARVHGDGVVASEQRGGERQAWMQHGLHSCRT